MSGEKPFTPPEAEVQKAPNSESTPDYSSKYESEAAKADSQWQEAKTRFEQLKAVEGKNLVRLAEIACIHEVESYYDLIELLRKDQTQFSEEELGVIKPMIEKLQTVAFDRIIFSFKERGYKHSFETVATRLPTAEEVEQKRVEIFLYQLAEDLMSVCVEGWNNEEQTSVEDMIKNIETKAKEDEDIRTSWEKVKEYVKDDVLQKALEDAMDIDDVTTYVWNPKQLELTDLKKAI